MNEMKQRCRVGFHKATCSTSLVGWGDKGGSRFVYKVGKRVGSGRQSDCLFENKVQWLRENSVPVIVFAQV